MPGFGGSASLSMADLGVWGQEVGQVWWAGAAGPEHVQPLPAGWAQTGGRFVQPLGTTGY